jgi:hypothetical protein
MGALTPNGQNIVTELLLCILKEAGLDFLLKVALELKFQPTPPKL